MNSNFIKAIEASVQAGKEILKVYYSDDLGVEFKDDESPLTLADKAAHNVIMECLSEINIPVLSEEGRGIVHDERKDWSQFWMVDPLDGTKEFIKKGNDFTVNIALIENGYPTFGVVFAPVLGKLYYGDVQNGAYMIQLEEGWEKIKDYKLEPQQALKLPLQKREDDKFIVVASKSHLSKETVDFVDQVKKDHRELEFVSIGSSLKICMVAEGKADLFPRLSPCMEWDTAAGQAVLESAGMNIVQYPEGKRVEYNKENLLNPWFVVYGERLTDNAVLNYMQSCNR
ncbi:3'(2'),5'-bisphosphate nucleotidase CysQ [bacterium]|nr:3'(2'),5'-bisphosphate nucleotidase CysQ [bacterium]